MYIQGRIQSKFLVEAALCARKAPPDRWGAFTIIILFFFTRLIYCLSYRNHLFKTWWVAFEKSFESLFLLGAQKKQSRKVGRKKTSEQAPSLHTPWIRFWVYLHVYAYTKHTIHQQTLTDNLKTNPQQHRPDISGLYSATQTRYIWSVLSKQENKVNIFQQKIRGLS